MACNSCGGSTSVIKVKKIRDNGSLIGKKAVILKSRKLKSISIKPTNDLDKYRA